MPDPKGLAQAIAPDLQAVGFTINLKTEGWRTGYISDEDVGKFPMWLLGWTCDWAGPDNFLTPRSSTTTATQADPGVRLQERRELKTTLNQALAATDRGQVQTYWEQGAGHDRGRPADRPARQLDPAGSHGGYVQGFQGAGNLTELFNSVWLNK